MTDLQKGNRMVNAFQQKLFLTQYELVWKQRDQHVGHIWAIPAIITGLLGIAALLLAHGKIEFVTNTVLKIISILIISIGFIGLFLRHNFFIKVLGLTLKSMAKRQEPDRWLPQFGSKFKMKYKRFLNFAEKIGSWFTGTFWWAIVTIGLISLVIFSFLSVVKDATLQVTEQAAGFSTAEVVNSFQHKGGNLMETAFQAIGNCPVYWLIAVGLSLYYGIRGMLIKNRHVINENIQLEKGQPPLTPWTKKEKVLVHFIQDFIFNAFCSMAGFVSLWILAHVFPSVDSSSKIDAGLAVLIVFLALLAITGIGGILPYVIVHGKIFSGNK